MFEIWRAKRGKRKAEEAYHARLVQLRSDKNSTSEELRGHFLQEQEDLRNIDQGIDSLLSTRLIEKAEELDVDIPSYEEKECWRTFWGSSLNYLTPYGRSRVRKLIDKEKARRFEVATRWVKLIAMLAPVLGAAAGLVGAMIGWVAIHKK